MRCCPAPRARRKTLTPARSAPALAGCAQVRQRLRDGRDGKGQRAAAQDPRVLHPRACHPGRGRRQGAWWVPLRKLVGDIGQEATEEALEAFEAALIKDRKERLEQVLAGNSSEDDREDDDL